MKQLKELKMDKTTLRELRRNIRRLELALGSFLDPETTCCGVTAAQCHTLLSIEEKGETTITQLALEMNLDKSTLSRTIDGMVGADLVFREVNRENRRSQRLKLTPKGQKTADGINRQWDQYYCALFSRIPPKKRASVMESLAILSREIAASPGVAVCAPAKEKK